MRLALLCVLLSPVLCAMDAEAVRFARRTLLDPSARRHLKADVRDLAALSACTVLRGHFDGDEKPDSAAVVRHDKNLVVALFPGRSETEAPAIVQTLTLDQVPTVDMVHLPGRDCVRLSTDLEQPARPPLAASSSSVRWTILRIHKDAWQESLCFTHSSTRRIQRMERLQTTTIEVQGGKVFLATVAVDKLDAIELPGSRATTRVGLSLDAEGRFRSGDTTGTAVPVATRTQIARMLEREGLLEAALEQANEAARQAEREQLPADDARWMEARSMQQRLRARLPAAVVAAG